MLAIAVGQFASMVNVMTPSRAGSLPHWIFCEHKFYAQR
ncbi:hypothetical protein [Pseudomonas sp. FG-3G]|nr:hypothetical protein [Pseudomonas sp. FG-3G]